MLDTIENAAGGNQAELPALAHEGGTFAITLDPVIGEPARASYKTGGYYE